MIPDMFTTEEIIGFTEFDGGMMRTLAIQYLERLRENERYKEALQDIANGTSFPARVAVVALTNYYNDGKSNG